MHFAQTIDLIVPSIKYAKKAHSVCRSKGSEHSIWRCWWLGLLLLFIAQALGECMLGGEGSSKGNFSTLRIVLGCHQADLHVVFSRHRVQTRRRKNKSKVWWVDRLIEGEYAAECAITYLNRTCGYLDTKRRWCTWWQNINYFTCDTLNTVKESQKKTIVNVSFVIRIVDPILCK